MNNESVLNPSGATTLTCHLLFLKTLTGHDVYMELIIS